MVKREGFTWELNQGKKYLLDFSALIFLALVSLEIKVENNNLIGSIPSWGPSFKISFELKILSFANCHPLGMANYLTFTSTDSDCCNIGDRIPAFFTNNGGFLQLVTQINNNGNHIKSSPKLQENIWYKIDVEQLLKDNDKVANAF